MEWEDASRANQFLKSDELPKRMQQAGVLGGPDVRYLTEMYTVRRSAADQAVACAANPEANSATKTSVRSPREVHMERWFSRFATHSSNAVGSSWAFLFALVTIVVWLATGPLFHFSNTWQLIINSWTNIATFIVVFLIQNAQNRDSKAINLKLAELIRAVGGARDDMMDVERLTDPELEQLSARYSRIREEWQRRQKRAF